MNKNKIYELINWLNERISHLQKSLREANEMQNYGKAVQCEGMLNAFRQCLDKLTPMEFES